MAAGDAVGTEGTLWCLAMLDVCWRPTAELSKWQVRANHPHGSGLVQLLLGDGSQPGQGGVISIDPPWL